MENKIKIEIGSYIVTVNSVQEARDLMGMTRENVSKSSTRVYRKKADRVNSDEHVVKINKKLDGRRFNGGNNKNPRKEPVVREDGSLFDGTGNKWAKMVVNRKEKKERQGFKNRPGSKWLPEEVQYIIDNLDMGSGAMTRSKNLLARHTRMGIQQMFWKASRNPAGYKVPADIQAVVDAYHNNKPQE